MKLHTLTTTVAGLLISGILAYPAFAAEDTDTTTAEADTTTTDTDTTKFSDEELLIETLLKDDQEAIDKADEDLADAQQALEDAQAADAEDPDAYTDEEIQEFEDAVAQAEEDQASVQDSLSEEEERVTDQVENELTDEQVVNLNRSLNNANASGLTVDLDAEDLQAAIDGEYNLQQINTLTKSAEAEAKFDSLADKFEARAEETGNDKFLEHSERMANKADTERDKFRDKIGHFDSLKDKDAEHAARMEAKEEAKNAAKHASRDVAKGLAKQAAKDAAKDAAKRAAKDNAKDHAKQTAKQIVKEEGRKAAKDHGKGKGPDNS